MTNEEIVQKGNELTLNFYSAFSAAMDREMTARKMTATQLHNRIGYSANVLRAYRRGDPDRAPSIKGMCHVASYFGYDSLFAFIGGEEIRKEIDNWVENVKDSILSDLQKQENSVNSKIRNITPTQSIWRSYNNDSEKRANTAETDPTQQSIWRNGGR